MQQNSRINPIYFPESIVSYNWDFGDGGTSTDRNPTHVYTTASVYTVSLTVTSQLGCSNTISQTVSIIDSAIAGFSVYQ